MKTFEFWTKWGSELNDRDFANAFTALGILAGRKNEQKSANPLLSTIHDQQIIQNLASAELKEALSIKRSLYSRFILINWKFPLIDRQLFPGEYQFCLSDLDPQRLADSWKSLTENNLSDKKTWTEDESLRLPEKYIHQNMV